MKWVHRFRCQQTVRKVWNNRPWTVWVIRVKPHVLQAPHILLCSSAAVQQCSQNTCSSLCPTCLRLHWQSRLNRRTSVRGGVVGERRLCHKLNEHQIKLNSEQWLHQATVWFWLCLNSLMDSARWWCSSRLDASTTPSINRQTASQWHQMSHNHSVSQKYRYKILQLILQY